MAIGSFVPRIPSPADRRVAQVVKAVSAPIIRQQPSLAEKLIGVGPQPYGGSSAVGVPSLLGGPSPPPPKPAIAVLGRVTAPRVTASKLIASPTQAYGYVAPSGASWGGPEASVARHAAAQAAQPNVTDLSLPPSADPIVVEAEPMDQSPTYAGDGEQAYAQTFGGGGGFALAASPFALASSPASGSPPQWAWVVGGGVVLAAVVYWAHKKRMF